MHNNLRYFLTFSKVFVNVALQNAFIKPQIGIQHPKNKYEEIKNIPKTFPGKKEHFYWMDSNLHAYRPPLPSRLATPTIWIWIPACVLYVPYVLVWPIVIFNYFSCFIGLTNSRSADNQFWVLSGWPNMHSTCRKCFYEGWLQLSACKNNTA